MKNLVPLSVAAACVIAGATDVSASCLTNGVSTQSVSLSSGNKFIERWQVKPNEIHRNRLPNGFELGLKIEPAPAETYAEIFARTKSKAFDELVKISVYDMSGTEPKLLTQTGGGANSKQGYGPRGGADGVPAIGEPGIELWLHKPACVTADDLAKLK